jgi:hypothetical protein
MLAAAEANAFSAGRLPDFVGSEFLSIEPAGVRSR